MGEKLGGVIWVVLTVFLIGHVGQTQHIPGAPYGPNGPNGPKSGDSGITQQGDNAGCKLEDGIKLCPAVFEVGE